MEYYSMSANGISALGTKQAKQEAKLEIAEAKRQGNISWMEPLRS